MLKNNDVAVLADLIKKQEQELLVNKQKLSEIKSLEIENFCKTLISDIDKSGFSHIEIKKALFPKLTKVRVP